MWVGWRVLGIVEIASGMGVVWLVKILCMGCGCREEFRLCLMVISGKFQMISSGLDLEGFLGLQFLFWKSWNRYDNSWLRSSYSIALFFWINFVHVKIVRWFSSHLYGNIFKQPMSFNMINNISITMLFSVVHVYYKKKYIFFIVIWLFIRYILKVKK